MTGKLAIWSSFFFEFGILYNHLTVTKLTGYEPTCIKRKKDCKSPLCTKSTSFHIVLSCYCIRWMWLSTLAQIVDLVSVFLDLSMDKLTANYGYFEWMMIWFTWVVSCAWYYIMQLKCYAYIHIFYNCLKKFESFCQDNNIVGTALPIFKGILGTNREMKPTILYRKHIIVREVTYRNKGYSVPQ